MINQSQSIIKRLSSYAEISKTAMVTTESGKALIMYHMRAMNRSTGANNVGIMKKLSLTSAKFFTYTAVGTVYAEVSPSAASLTLFTTTNNDGFVVGHKNRFGLVGMTISQAQAGATIAYQYWNGSAWTTLPTEKTMVVSATADTYVAFLAPIDWARGGTGLDSNYFYIRIRATTAGTPAALASALWMADFLDYYTNVADQTGVELEFDIEKPLLLEAGEGLMPYFSTAHANNYAVVFYANY